MRTLLRMVACAAVLAGGAGCQKEPRVSRMEHRAPVNEAMLRLIYEESARNAVLAERAVYPHYFQPHSPRLNELGQRQLEVLATLYRGGPAPLHMVRGGVAEDLYAGRVQAVRDELSRVGVDAAQVQITEGFAGGAGVGSEHAVEVLRGQTPQRGLRTSDGAKVGGERE